MKSLRLLLALFCAVPAFAQKEALQRAVGTNTVTGSLASTPFQVATIAALKATVVTNIATGTQVYVAGYRTNGDGGQGYFTYNSASASTDDGGIVIAPNAGSGRWLRNVSGNRVNVLWFGAVPDGTTDSTTAINNAFTGARALSLPSGVVATVYFPTGSYLTGTVNFTKCAVTGESMSGTIVIGKAGQDVFAWATPGTAGYSSVQNNYFGKMTIVVNTSTDARSSFPNRVSFSGDRVANCGITYQNPSAANSGTNIIGNVYEHLNFTTTGGATGAWAGAIFTDLGTYAWKMDDIAIANGSSIGFGLIQGMGSELGRQVTFTSGTNLVNCTGHPYANNQQLAIFASAVDGVLPTGLSSGQGLSGQLYYVINSTANTFQLSLTSGGAAVAFVTNGSGHLATIRAGATAISAGYSSDEMLFGNFEIHTGYVGMCLVNVNNSTFTNITIHPQYVALMLLTYADGQAAHSGAVVCSNLYTEGPLTAFTGTYIYFSSTGGVFNNMQVGSGAQIVQEGNGNYFKPLFTAGSASTQMTLNGNSNVVDASAVVGMEGNIVDNGFGNKILYYPDASGLTIASALPHYDTHTYLNYGAFEPDYLFRTPSQRYQSNRTLFIPGANIRPAPGSAYVSYQNLQNDSSLETLGYCAISSNVATYIGIQLWSGANNAAGQNKITTMFPASMGTAYVRIKSSVNCTVNLIANPSGTNVAASLTTSWQTFAVPFDYRGKTIADTASFDIHDVSTTAVVSVAWVCWVPAPDAIWSKTVTSAGTTGARTINANTGSVNFAAAATSLVVTNSLVTSSSIITTTLGTNDATAVLGAAVAAAGSFTIYMKTAPTAETRVNFSVSN